MAFTQLLKPITVVSCALLFSSCAQMATSREEPLPTPVVAAPPIQKEPLSGESLFQLLLAEIATNRRELGAAAALYGELGQNYNDVNAIERAVALNQSVGDYEKVFTLSEKWVELRPGDAAAIRAQSLSAIATNRLDVAQLSLSEWLQTEPNADVSLILPSTENLSPELRTQLVGVLDNLQAEFPNSSSLYYTRARLAFAAQDSDLALSLTDKSLAIADNLQVSLFKFQILLATNNSVQAKSLIESLYDTYPTNRQVAIQYTRFTYRYEPENLDVLQKLHNRFSTESTIARTYARAAFDQQDYDSAQAIYQHLLDQGYADEAHYFLGRIDIVNEMQDSATEHFEAVMQPPYVASALAEWVSMARPDDQSRLVSAINNRKEALPNLAPTLWRLHSSYFQLIDQLEVAWDILDQGILRFPDDVSLLYDQAMLAAALERFTVLENNLEAVLELDPDNINALNALGYTWADLNKNMDLAIQYIEKALSADPTNPAFQDSKGWYLYRLGDYEESLVWLKKAYSQMENDEVAAHLAQVLWALQRKEEARNYLAEIKRINPESKYASELDELFNQ